MFKDIKNRPLHMGDIVIFSFMESINFYGVLISDNELVTKSGLVNRADDIKYCYLIENPDENELALKEKCLQKYQIELNNKIKAEQKKQIQALNTNYKAGYVLKYGVLEYLYLGNISLISNDSNINSQSGHAYVRVPCIYKGDYERLVLDLLAQQVVIKSKDMYVGPLRFKTLTDIEIIKTKSKKFESVIYNVGILCLNNQILTSHYEVSLNNYNPVGFKLVFK